MNVMGFRGKFKDGQQNGQGIKSSEYSSMDIDQVGQRLEVEYCKGLFWDQFWSLSSLMTSMKKYFVVISKLANDTKNSQPSKYLNDVIHCKGLDKLVAWVRKRRKKKVKRLSNLRVDLLVVELQKNILKKI